jgi:hypothetical protein
MIGEADLFGVFFSTALAAACIAFVALLILRTLLRGLGFYRIVWHRTLADLALFTLLWFGSVWLFSHFVGPLAWPS